MKRLQSNDKKARIAIVLFWVMIAAYVASMISSYMQYEMIQGLWAGEEFTAEALESNDSRELITGIISFFTFIFAATGFYFWLKTAYENLSFKTLNLVNNELWDKGLRWYGYLYVPYKVTKELFTVTKDLLLGKGLISVDKLSTSLFGVWWAFFLFSQFLGRVVSRAAKDVDSLSGMNSLTMWQIFFEVVAIIFGLLSIKIISDYSAVEPLVARLPDSKMDFIVDPIPEGEREY